MIAIGQIRKHFWISLYFPMTIRDFPSQSRVSGVMNETQYSQNDPNYIHDRDLKSGSISGYP